MQRFPLCILLWCAAIAPLRAHFLFVVADSDGQTARVVLSETLEPDPSVPVSIAKGAKLSLRDEQGNHIPLAMEAAGFGYRVILPGKGNRVVHGTAHLGFAGRPTPKPYVLVYYPKTILDDPLGKAMQVGGDAAIEIVPVGKPGAIQLRVLAKGKPLADSEVTVIVPGGEQKKVKTGPDGVTPAFSEGGRFGAWARYWEDAEGQHEGRSYQQVRHYAMLVFDAPAVTGSESTGKLPEATSSFGAAVQGDWLYVYGGHVARTHVYHTESVSGRFHRMRLGSSGESAWESLPAGPGLQGMNLVAHGGKIYLAGGMAPQNKKGEKTNHRSTADVSRYDPASRTWEKLPPLPEARSSHDIVAVGNRLVVVGGWLMDGSRQKWADTIAILYLDSAKPTWKQEPQPFQRRALIAAVYQQKVYVIGGINAKGAVEQTVSIYDPSANTWSEGPPLPGSGIAGFAPAAAVHQGKLYVSVADGAVWRLGESGTQWEAAGRGAGRVAHRMVSGGRSGLLVLGGAAKGDNLDAIERVAQ